MYQFPLGHDRQKQMYDNLETNWSENARDKSSPLPLRRHTLHHAPSECRRVWTRWIAPCRCRFDYSTHKCATRSTSNNGHAHWFSGLLSFQELHRMFDGPRRRKNVTYLKNLIHVSPFDSEEDRWGSSSHQAATWYFWGHTSITAASASAVYRGRWPYVCKSVRSW